MTEEKSLGQILGEKLFESLSSQEKAKVVTVTLPPIEKEIYDYLENLKRFEEESRKVNIRIGGNNCGYCNPAYSHC